MSRMDGKAVFLRLALTLTIPVTGLVGCAPPDESPERPTAEAPGRPTAAAPAPVDGSRLPGSRTPLPDHGVRLALIVSVDMLGTTELSRFRPVLTGGLDRLLGEGVLFAEADHRHAVTVTAPGHASLATGLHPAHHGVIDNEWFSREEGKEINCVDDPVHGRSPRNLQGTALGDWVKAASPGSKVFSASGKDRSAILMGGHHADGAYWYDRDTGRFTSSAYYSRAAPAWLEAFNDRRFPDDRFGHPWEPLALGEEDLAVLGLVEPDTGVFQPAGFPHAIGRPVAQPDEEFYEAFYESPFVDEVLVRLAERLVESEGLGADGALDLLLLSFSALDSVGHDYGPDSREYLDALLRLDRWLNELFGYLDRHVGRDHLLVALSSDHGVAPLPEVRRGRGENGKRLDDGDALCVQRAGRRVDERFGEEDWLLDDLYINPTALGSRGVSRRDVEDTLKAALESCAAVRRVWTRSELEGSSGPPNGDAELFVNTFHQERSPDLLVQLEPYHLDRSGRGTTHGSPYLYDTRVPIVIVGPGIEPATIREPVSTVDLAPTLAGWLGVPIPATVDGVDRSGLLRKE
jgi:predicted AlkP superfamily pyrophosphatase or phosphodiesterase